MNGGRAQQQRCDERAARSQNEGFVRHEGHLCAVDPAPFREAAAALEAGGSLEEAMNFLSEQHRTTLFYVEKRPPLPMLASRGDEAPAILRQCADQLEGQKDEQ
tara:strand:+ start:58 stop:369 length:312 start_codon:yes stop_codon:yes gene_type:complete